MPEFSRRLRSLLRGEVSAVELERRRRAGGSAYSLAEEAADATGDDRSTRLFRLCAWNAFALQTIADTMLDADAREDPGTAGYVRRSTLDYVSDCLDRVPTWLRAARIVQNDPTAQIDVPAALPKWVLHDSTTHIELHALRSAYDALQPRIESDLNALAARSAPDDEAVRRLKRLFAEMTSAVEYAQGLDDPRAGPVERGEIRWRLLDALENAFLLGQLLAVPTLTKVVPLEQAAIDRPEMAAAPPWLEIRTSWPVCDCAGELVGHVERVRGDRSTGELECIEVDQGVGHATLRVPAASIAQIEQELIRLGVTREEIRRA